VTTVNAWPLKAKCPLLGFRVKTVRPCRVRSVAFNTGLSCGRRGDGVGRGGENQGPGRGGVSRDGRKEGAEQKRKSNQSNVPKLKHQDPQKAPDWLRGRERHTKKKTSVVHGRAFIKGKGGGLGVETASTRGENLVAGT